MQFSATLLLAASALVAADVENEGNHGAGGRAWVKNFDNLVAFGDRYGNPQPQLPTRKLLTSL
jgi:hypothetical protein